MNLCDICGREKKFQHERYCIYKKEDVDSARELYNNGLSVKEMIDQGLTRSLICFALKGMKKRTLSEAALLAHKRNPELFKHTEQTKQKIRKARIKYMHDHQGIPRWRESHNVMSYPEKIFADIIKRNNLTQKYDIIREYCIFPYYADFAFLNIQLDVEVDGSQHWRSENRKANDKKRDDILIQKGWKLYRIPEFKLKREFELIERDFLTYLATIETQPKKLAFDDEIIQYEKIKKQKADDDLKKRELESLFMFTSSTKSKYKTLEVYIQILKQRMFDLQTVDLTIRGNLRRLRHKWQTGCNETNRMIRNREIYCKALRV
jgi:very-short-patch-repair endonuclease